MKRTALFLKEEQVKKLLVLSEKTGAPMSELTRRAIAKDLGVSVGTVFAMARERQTITGVRRLLVLT